MPLPRPAGAAGGPPRSGRPAPDARGSLRHELQFLSGSQEGWTRQDPESGSRQKSEKGRDLQQGRPPQEGPHPRPWGLPSTEEEEGPQGKAGRSVDSGQGHLLPLPLPLPLLQAAAAGGGPHGN